MQRSFIYLSVLCVDAGQVDLGREFHLWWCIGVVWAAVDRHTVDAVLVNALCPDVSVYSHKACSRILREVVRVLCRSSLTLTNHRHCRAHMSMPLFTLSIRPVYSRCGSSYQRRDPSLPSRAPLAGGSCVVLWRPCLLLCSCKAAWWWA